MNFKSILKNIGIGTNKSAKSGTPVNPVDAFYEATFKILGQLVVADGCYSDNEVIEVNNFIRVAFALSPSQEKKIRKFFSVSLNSGQSAIHHAEKFFREFPNHVLLHELIVDVLIQISYADGNYSVEEEDLVIKVAKLLNIYSDTYNRLKLGYNAQNKDDEDHYYRLLGATRDTSNEELRQKFEQLASLYSLTEGADSLYPESLQTYILRKYERIEQAYSIILEEKGFGSLRN